MLRRRETEDPVLAEQVRARLDHLLSESPPRRPRRVQASAGEAGTLPRSAPGSLALVPGSPAPRRAQRQPDRAAPELDEDVDEDPPLDEDLDRGWRDDVRHPRRPAEHLEALEPFEALGAFDAVDADLGDPGVEEDRSWRRPFGRAHLGVICGLVVVALLCAGWGVLRARPVAIASTPGGSVPVAVPSASSGAASSSGKSSGPASGTPTASRILVHVLGAVRKPGVVSLADRARVQDAIDAAGGLTKTARPGNLNLAALLQDGQQVVIGTAKKPSSEVRDSSTDSANSGSSPGTGAGSQVDLNRADLSALDTLPGVGPVTAGKILAWRQEHGRFSRVEELQEVDGIGPKTYADIAPHVRV